MTENPRPSDVPRAGQEAAKLLASAQDWLRTSAPHLAPVDADGSTCTCPLCRAVAGVREADPDVVGRWVDSAVAAATSVLAQAGERLASTVGDEGTSASDDAGYAWADADADAAGEPPGADAPVGTVPDDAAGQDEERARGVRRIPLEQTEPGDLDG